MTVTRVGTQVVVRLGGIVDDAGATRLDAALDEIGTLVLNRVVVDCSGATAITGAGVRFLLEARARWPVRLLYPLPGLQQVLAQAI